MTLSFHDLPPALDKGTSVSYIDVHDSARTYIKQLQIKAENPFRGLNFPLGDETSGEQDCRVTGIVYRIRPVKLDSGDWNFSIQDTVDSLRGLDAVAKLRMGLEESDIDVIVKGKQAATLRVLNQFRGTEPADEKCLDHHSYQNVQEVAAV